MALTNQQRVGKALDLLREGLGPFVEREVHDRISAGTVNMDRILRFQDDPILRDKQISKWDVAGILRMMTDVWNDVFRYTLGFSERSYASELRDWRNKWAHQEPFSSEDAERALDSAERLLTAVSAPQAEELKKMKHELRRLVFDEQVRGQKRKAGGSLIEAASTDAVKPWRDVVTPHADVATGRFQNAEFAADLWQVHLGEGSDEYRDPKEFFRRTYLTESLSRLLVGAVRRINGAGGDPVVQLQTNFGGGKTHSMLALYHLFSGERPSELPGVEGLLSDEEQKTLPRVNRVVLVGNKISPGNPVTKPDGTVVNTLWGELAWQLGGRAAYDRIRGDDERATNPGDALRELFKEHGPCLILIDEWVAYARQLHESGDLPAGDFETQFTFAQALTESAKLAGNCLLVISLPASDTTGSPHTQADDVEVGGIRGREALERLRNVIGRVESSWRPATAAEGFEIVRRRLFEPLGSDDAFKQRDVTARAFSELYRKERAEFPTECSQSDYEKRIKAAYPIHPEIFDRLYEDWSTLVKFQRTRGVLRLMATVIHTLWEKGDKNPLILPSTIPIDDGRVQFELTRYLSDSWQPIISKDVDGPESLPQRLDNEQPNLGKYHAARRVARTIYLGSAPTVEAAHRGLEDRRIRLGCVMPGEPAAVFGDALRRLAASATYLYQDGNRFWYSTQPTVTKLAEDRSEQLKRDEDTVVAELERRVRADLSKRGEFGRVHAMPRSSGDVSDEYEARLVVLPSEHCYSKDADNLAIAAAREILENRGTQPRLYRNTLVFLAADKVRLQDLDEALRRYLAWESILNEKEQLNLDPHQVKQAETQKQAAESMVAARIPETYMWLLVPTQKEPAGELEWNTIKLSGTDPLAERASRKLRSDEYLITTYGPTLLRMNLDRIPLWRGDHVPVRTLIEDFAKYLYLPRMANPTVLATSIGNGPGLTTWESEAFAYAEQFDEKEGRYRGLIAGEMKMVTPDDSGLVVKPEVAMAQRRADEEKRAAAAGTTGTTATAGSTSTTGSSDSTGTSPSGDPGGTPFDHKEQLRRYYGTVKLDATRVGMEAGRIAEEVIAHLTSIVGAEVTVTLEIEARLPEGASDHLVRTVTENGRVLRFESGEFEGD